MFSYICIIKPINMKRNIIFATIVSLFLISCSDNSIARRWGGSEEISLKPNERLLTITWKETSLWILTEDTVTGVQYFREKSPYGMVEGQIIINDAK